MPKSFTGFEEAEISSCKLEMVEISPLNINYVYKDDKYLLGKCSISAKRIGFGALSSNNIKIVEITDAALLDFLDKSVYGNTILIVPFKNK
mgnify:CR=1 FL=1